MDLPKEYCDNIKKLHIYTENTTAVQENSIQYVFLLFKSNIIYVYRFWIIIIYYVHHLLKQE